jgi:hypothetical protein
MPRPWQTLSYKDFLGLYDGVPAEAQPGQASVVDNLYKSRDALKRRAGFTALGAALSPAQSHDGLGWFKIASTEYLIAAHDGKLVDWLNASPGATLTNSTGKLTSGSDANATWLDAKVYWGDGTKQNVRFDGTDVVQVLTETPNSAASVAVGAATGPTGTYTYYVTFISDDGNHSPVSPLSGSVSVTNQKVSITNIPTCGAGQDCSGRGIWRNKNNTTDYYFVDTVAGNVTTTYTDETTDDDLGIELVEVLGANLQNVRFPPCRYLITHQSRLVGAYSTASGFDKQTVYLSNFREPWYSPTLPDLDDPAQGGPFPLQGPGAGEVTGLASHGNQIAVFTADAAWLLTTSDQLLDYTLHRFSNHGCVAHRTIASVKDRLLWASSDGIYQALEGEGVSRISDDIKTTYQAISAADLAKSHGFIWDDKYFFCWPSGCRVYDLKYRLWTRNTNWTWRVATVTASGQAVERVYGALLDVARVFRLENGADDNGTAITALWGSHDFDMGMMGREKRLHQINVHWKASTGTGTLRAYKGTGTTAQQTATRNLATVDDTGGTVSSLRQRCVEQLRSDRFRLEVEYAGSNADYQLLQVEVLFIQIT